MHIQCSVWGSVHDTMCGMMYTYKKVWYRIYFEQSKSSVFKFVHNLGRYYTKMPHHQNTSFTHLVSGRGT